MKAQYQQFVKDVGYTLLESQKSINDIKKKNRINVDMHMMGNLRHV